MKLKNILLYLLPIAGLCSSCNDEWENEQFTHYISFKAPINSDGVSRELSVRGLVFAYRTECARKTGIRTDIIRGEDGYLALQLKQFGKIAFVRKRRARAVTGYGTVGADGTLFNSFKVRVVSRLKGIGGLFTQKKEYKDEESNLVKKK